MNLGEQNERVDDSHVDSDKNYFEQIRCVEDVGRGSQFFWRRAGGSSVRGSDVTERKFVCVEMLVMTVVMTARSVVKWMYLAPDGDGEVRTRAGIGDDAVTNTVPLRGGQVIILIGNDACRLCRVLNDTIEGIIQLC